MRSVLSIGCFVVAMLMSGAALADAPSSADIKKAAVQYDMGRERFRAGAYTEAAERFEAADSYAPSAPALRLAMLSRREAGHMERAATLAALALERHPDETELVTEAQEILSQVEGELAQVDVTCDSPCELVLNDRLVHGQASQSRTLYVQPGTIVIRAGWSDDRSDSERVNVTLGAHPEVSFYAPLLDNSIDSSGANTDFEALDDEEEDTVEEKKGKPFSPAVFWTGFALTGVSAGATLGLGLNALNNPGADAVKEDCQEGDRECPTFKKGQRNQTYANVAVGVTSGLAVFTLVSGIFLTDWGGSKKKKKEPTPEPAWKDTWGRLQLRPVVTIGDGATLGATGVF